VVQRFFHAASFGALTTLAVIAPLPASTRCTIQRRR
jgi:hypothetical protein